uniref:Uncharacterized protein n=1 Tax=Pithovirus LCDPAC02 TaxID=2506601 RepID=A0A481YNK7_9VIRU|nr:MAG: hypothetical protein LCDPAC02_01120 [Pithovirus LCDPAC02]
MELDCKGFVASNKRNYYVILIHNDEPYFLGIQYVDGIYVSNYEIRENDNKCEKKSIFIKYIYAHNMDVIDICKEFTDIYIKKLNQDEKYISYYSSMYCDHLISLLVGKIYYWCSLRLRCPNLGYNISFNRLDKEYIDKYKIYKNIKNICYYHKYIIINDKITYYE